MSVPTFTHDLTIIDDADSTSGWVAIGGSMISTTDGLQGSAAILIEYNAVGTIGAVRGPLTAFDATAETMMFWLSATAAFHDTLANGGVFVQISSDVADPALNHNRWYVGGGDVGWTKDGGFRRIMLDVSLTPDETAGSPDLTNATFIGLGFVTVATSMRAGALIDIMHRGTKFEVTGPSYTGNGSTDLDFVDGGGGNDSIVRTSGSWITDGFENGDTITVTGSVSNNGTYVINTAPVALTITVATASLVTESNVAATVMAHVGFQDIIDKDEADDIFLGFVVINNRATTFEINGPLFIGDESGALDIVFETKGERVMFADQPLIAATRNDLVLHEDTGLTTLLVGEQVGSGDAKVGFNGTVWNRTKETFGLEPLIDFKTNAVDAVNVYGSLFRNIGSGIDFAADTGHECVSCTFSKCGQVELGSVFARKLLFDGYETVLDGALLWNDNIDVEDSNFFANANATSNATAIEHPDSAGSPYAYDNLKFAGNDFDVANTSGSAITINKSNGADPTTSEGSAVTFAATVTVKVTVKTTLGVNIENARVLVEADSGGDLPAKESVTITRSGSTASVAHTAHGMANGQLVIIRNALQPEYNKIVAITNVTTNAYDYTVSGTPTTPATGTITSTGAVLSGLTNASGVLEDTGFNFTSTQPIIGVSRKSTASPFFKSAQILGSVLAETGFETVVQMVLNE